MKTILFKDLDDNQILNMVDPAIPYILLPGFRLRSAREWWTTSIQLDAKEKLENIEVRDLTGDIMTSKSAVEQIFKRGQFNQMAIWQFNKRIPATLKIDELRPETSDSILIQNGLVNRIWINHEHVEFSSIDDNYIKMMMERYKGNLV